MKKVLYPRVQAYSVLLRYTNTTTREITVTRPGVSSFLKVYGYKRDHGDQIIFASLIKRSFHQK